MKLAIGRSFVNTQIVLGVSPFFQGSSGIWLEFHPLAIDTVVTLGQGKLPKYI